jgi:hypothetical protein
MAGGTKNTTNRTQHLDKSPLSNWAIDCPRHVVLRSLVRPVPTEGGKPPCFISLKMQNKPNLTLDPGLSSLSVRTPQEDYYAKQSQFPIFSTQKQGSLKKQTQNKLTGFIRSSRTPIRDPGRLCWSTNLQNKAKSGHRNHEKTKRTQSW